MSRNKLARPRTDLATIPVPAVDDMIRTAVDAAPDLPAELAQRLTELIRSASDDQAEAVAA